MNLNIFENFNMNLNSCIETLAIANNKTTSGNLNYVVIGLIVVVLILVIVTLKNNK